MFRTRVLFPVLMTSLLASSGAQASTILFAHLTHDQEPPPGGTTPLTTSGGAPRPLSFGTAIFVLNDAMTQMTMFASVHNIDINNGQTPADTNDNLGAAHIHVGAPPGVNGPVRWGFFGLPDNDTNPKQMVITPFVGAVGGTFSSIWDLPEGNAGTTLATNLPTILAGLSYINFHTGQFGGGEIRGQLNVVPEPTTLILLGSGIAAALGRRRTLRRGRLL